MLFLLMAAVPPVKVLLILEARRNDWDPSRPTTEPLKQDAPNPRTATKSLLMSSLKQPKKRRLYKKQLFSPNRNYLVKNTFD